MLGRVALACALLLAGCTSTTHPPGATSEPVAATTNGATSAPTSPIQQGPPTESVPVSWDGAFDAGACVPTGIDSCSGAGSSSVVTTKMYKGASAWSGDLVLTWDAQVSTDDQLEVRVVPIKGDPANWSGSGGSGTTGTSPLTLHVDIAATDDMRDGLALIVEHPRVTPSPLYTIVATPLSFHLEGTLTAERSLA